MDAITRERTRFAQLLRHHRETSGYSQNQIAHILGVERSTYSYYETGKTVPLVFDLMRLANLYRCSLDDLVGFRHEKSASALSSPEASFSKRYEDKFRETLQDLSLDERQLIALFRSVDAEGRAHVLEVLSNERRRARRP